jgi:dGTPase
VRNAGRAVVGFSPAMAESDRAIKALLRRDVYRHADVMAVMNRAETVVKRLFAHYREEPQTLPEGWRSPRGEDNARTIADFLAGMTDRYALIEHQRFFGGSADLR